LYNYITDAYDPYYDFSQAKLDNSQTPAYQKMMGAQKRDELFWLQDFVETGGYIELMEETNVCLSDHDQKYINDDSITGDYGKIFYDHCSWDKPVRVNIEFLHRSFRRWGDANVCEYVKKRTMKEFENNIITMLVLPFKVINCKGAGKLIEFVPKDLYFKMYDKYMMSPKEELLGQLKARRQHNKDEAPTEIKDIVQLDSDYTTTSGSDEGDALQDEDVALQDEDDAPEFKICTEGVQVDFK
jgi:hypothetical protein